MCILEYLCYYDVRNPNACDDIDVIESHNMGIRTGKIIQCFCDNCHYGRTQLAEYILKLESEV